MKLSFATFLLLTVGSVTATPLTRRQAKCAVDGGMGVCMSTTQRCVGGSFHQTKGACAGGDHMQCCIVSGSSTTRAKSGTAPPAAGSSPPPGGPLPGLNSVQSAHAWGIVSQVGADGVGRQGCLAAFATALVESSVYVYANNAVPSSLNYPHDKIGSDHDSVGIFQQRAQFYPDIAADMDPAKSAGQFFRVMKGISGWQTMDVGTLCQKVQKSAFPTRYSQKVGAATQICDAAGVH